MLKAENINSYYGNIQALDNVSIEVNKGEIVSITVSYTHLRAHETLRHLVCRLLLEKKKK